MGDEPGQCAYGDNRDLADERGLKRVDGGDVDGGDAALAGKRDHGQDAGGMAQRAVEAELAEEEVPRRVERDLFARGQQRHRHRQVVARTFLAQISRGQVDRDPAHGELQAGVAYGRAHALLGLVDGGVGQADDGESGESLRKVHLDLD